MHRPLLLAALSASILSCGTGLERDLSAPGAGALTGSGFAPQSRPLATPGDQWEPAIAADAFGHVYVLYSQWGGFPGCWTCPSPTNVLQISSDGGATWSAPTYIGSPGSGQWDPQIVVDPADGRTLFASWLQNNKSDTMVAKSTDFGATWSVVVADHMNAGTDKPILAVRGNDVYVAYDHQNKARVSASHDGGRTFTDASVNLNGQLGISLAGGGTVDPAGNVFFSWGGYEQNGKGNVHLFVSKSVDRGRTWTNTELDLSARPPSCSAYQCGWAFLAAQMALTSDAAGTLYALWNAGKISGGPERIFFSSSRDQGSTWSQAAELSTAPFTAQHGFPALVAGAAGDVRAAWMDTRQGSLWNVVYRSSTNGGASWSPETILSSYVPGYEYIQQGGFSFPFGDYFELAIDANGNTHAVFGEGLNWLTPGSIWTTRGR